MSQALPLKLQTAAAWNRFTRSSLHANHPVRRMSMCTTTPVTASGERSAGWPSMRTYWNPWVVCRGSKPPVGPSATTVSTCPAVSGCGRNGSAGRRCSTVTSPFSSSHSPWVSVSSVPAGPRPRPRPRLRPRLRPRPDRRTHPLMFWPRSTTWRSALTLVTDTGRSSSTRRTGGAGDQTRRSKPWPAGPGWTGRQSPPPARRRSVRCPSIRSAASTCDGRLCHDGPVPVTAVVPSRKTMRSWPRKAVRDPTGRRTAAPRPGRATSRH